MTLANLLCFLGGALVSIVCSWLYALHVESNHICQILAERRRSYDAGYSEGYKDRAMQSATGTLKQLSEA